MTRRLDEIRARLAAATQAPWEHHGDEFDYAEERPSVWAHFALTDLPDGGQMDHEIAVQGDDATDGDLWLIAHAPADLFHLLEELEDRTKERDEARAELSSLTFHTSIPHATWRGSCLHLWVKALDGETCPRCALAGQLEQMTREHSAWRLLATRAIAKPLREVYAMFRAVLADPPIPDCDDEDLR